MHLANIGRVTATNIGPLMIAFFRVNAALMLTKRICFNDSGIFFVIFLNERLNREKGEREKEGRGGR